MRPTVDPSFSKPNKFAGVSPRSNYQNRSDFLDPPLQQNKGESINARQGVQFDLAIDFA